MFSLSPLRARKSENYRYPDSWIEREPSKKKQITDTKKDVKRIKSENFTMGNREKFNIAIAILEQWMIG